MKQGVRSCLMAFAGGICGIGFCTGQQEMLNQLLFTGVFTIAVIIFCKKKKRLFHMVWMGV